MAIDRYLEDHRGRRFMLRMFFLLSLLLVILLIFGNSSEVSEVSAEKSTTVLEFCKQILTTAGVTSVQLTEHMVRKTAHFLEYSLLGFLLLLNLSLYVRKVLPFLAWPLFLGLFTAVCDEYFQLFVAGRAGLVADIVLDFLGILTGTVLGWLVVASAKLLRKKQRCNSRLLHIR